MTRTGEFRETPGSQRFLKMADARLFALIFLISLTENFKFVGVATNTFRFYKSKPITNFNVTEFLCNFTTLSTENAEVELCYLPWNEMPCASVKTFRCVFRRKFFGCPNFYYNNHVAVFVCFTLLVKSGDVELNPGPCEEQARAEPTMISRKTPTWKHPCALCSKPVRSNQKGILCDFCDRWHHIKCINMDLKTYVTLSSSEEEWRCCGCTTPFNFTDSFFEASHTSDKLLTDDNSKVSTTNRTNSFP